PAGARSVARGAHRVQNGQPPSKTRTMGSSVIASKTRLHGVSTWSTAELPRRYNAAADLLDGNLEAGRGGKVAIRTTGGEGQTYAEVAAAANRAGGALRGLGVEMENRVLMAVLDSVEFASAFFGAIKLGAIPIPVNTNLKPHDYAQFLADSRARVAIVSE